MTPQAPGSQPLAGRRPTVLLAAAATVATVVAGAPPALADPGHAPAAPAALTVTDGTSYRAAGPSKATFVGIQDGRAVFEVGSGRSSFHPVADTTAQPR